MHKHQLLGTARDTHASASLLSAARYMDAAVPAVQQSNIHTCAHHCVCGTQLFAEISLGEIAIWLA